jgi:hypothetical protein
VQSAIETMEHLALLKRWYYRSRHIGEIFLADDKGVFPMRRIVRGIGRVLRGEGPEPPQPVIPSGMMDTDFGARGAGENQDPSPRSG